MDLLLIFVFWGVVIYIMRRKNRVDQSPAQLVGRGPRSKAYHALLSEISTGVDRSGKLLDRRVRAILRSAIATGVKKNGKFKSDDGDVRQLVLADMHKRIMNDYLTRSCARGYSNAIYAEAAIWIEDNSNVIPVRGV